MKIFSPRFAHWCVWLLRLRHRCGYGVHSPWVFSLITGVIYEKESYYAYTEPPLREGDGHDVKIFRLLFRLANFVQPERGICVAASGAAYRKSLELGCRGAEWTGTDRDGGEEKVDMLYVGKDEDMRRIFLEYRDRASGKALFVFDGIHATPQRRREWKEICADPQGVTTLDLYDLGLVSFLPGRSKQHYVVNF